MFHVEHIFDFSQLFGTKAQTCSTWNTSVQSQARNIRKLLSLQQYAFVITLH